MGTLKTIFDIQLPSTIIFPPFHHLHKNWKKLFQTVSLSMKIPLPRWSEQDDPSQSWAEKWKRRCSHQFVVKALVTTSPIGFVTVTDITLPIAVQNFFFSQGGISNSEIVISLTTSTDFAIRFSQFSTINSDEEKWEKNQISLKVLH